MKSCRANFISPMKESNWVKWRCVVGGTSGDTLYLCLPGWHQFLFLNNEMKITHELLLGICVVKGKTTLTSTQITQKGNLWVGEGVYPKTYVWIIYQERGEVNKQFVNGLKHKFPTVSDFALQGTFSNVYICFHYYIWPLVSRYS